MSLALETEFAKALDVPDRPERLRSNFYGVEFLLEHLEKFRAEAEETSSLSEDSRQKLKKILRGSTGQRQQAGRRRIERIRKGGGNRVAGQPPEDAR